jgi:hypothetical protein
MEYIQYITFQTHPSDFPPFSGGCISQGGKNPPTDPQAKEYLRLQAAIDAALTEEYKALEVPKASSGTCQLGGKSCGCGRKFAASVRGHQLM